MSILSIEFAFLFLIFFCVYWVFARYPLIQKVLLLFSGFAFVCSYNPLFLLLSIPLSLLMMGLSRSKSPLVYKISLVTVVVPLLFFKYGAWVGEWTQQSLYLMGFSVQVPQVTWGVPLGISFYTFNLITYIVAKHRMHCEGSTFALSESEHLIERYVDLLLLTHFLPVMVSGPILRAEKMWIQWRSKERRIGEPSRILMLISMGLFKKLLLASYLHGSWMLQVFQNPAQYNSLELLVGMYAYAFEIYCDFSGYTDLVMAMGLLLGFDVPKNFNAPYIASNLKDFWKRWHISLSLWIRDYIYIPLGGNRGGFWKAQLWVFVSMVLSGVWHGSGASFLVWGILHAVGVLMVNVYQKYIRYPLPLYFTRFLTFHYVCFAWIFFKSPSLEQAHEWFYHLWINFYTPFSQPVLYGLGAGIFIYITQTLWVNLPERLENFLQSHSPVSRAGVFFVLLWLIITFSPSGIPNFIYAQF